MIHIKSSMSIPKQITLINKYIRRGMDLGALRVGEGVRDSARGILKSKVKGGKGTLLGEIDTSHQLKRATSIHSFSRTDVVVDTKAVPYAFWIEFGRDTPVGLPYSESDSQRDYRNSSFKGYEYLTGALRMYKGRLAELLVADSIIKMVTSKTLTKF